MKPYFSISVIFFLLLLALNQAAENRLQQHYWKHVMGDDPMPEAIQGLLPSTHEGDDPVGGSSTTPIGKERTWEDLINRDFDTRSVAIIYHHHDMMSENDHHGHDGYHVDRPRDEAS